MRNFEYYTPTQVLFGKDTHLQAGSLLKKYGAKKVLLPITSAADLGTVPSDLVGAFSLIFYSSPEEAVYKALGVE